MLSEGDITKRSAEHSLMPSLLPGKLRFKKESSPTQTHKVVIGHPQPPNNIFARSIGVNGRTGEHILDQAFIRMVLQARSSCAHEAHETLLHACQTMKGFAKVRKGNQPFANVKLPLGGAQVLYNKPHDIEDREEKLCRRNEDAAKVRSTSSTNEVLRASAERRTDRTEDSHGTDVMNESQISIETRHFMGRESKSADDRNGQGVEIKTEKRRLHRDTTRVKAPDLAHNFTKRTKKTTLCCPQSVPFTMKITKCQLRELIGTFEENDFDPPTDPSDPPSEYQRYCPLASWVKTDKKPPTGWAPGFYESVYQNEENEDVERNFRTWVMNNGCILRISRYTPEIVMTILESLYSTVAYLDTDDWIWDDQIVPIIRGIGSTWQICRSDNTWQSRTVGEQLNMSLRTCECISQICLAFTHEGQPNFLEQILVLLGQFELPNKAPQTDKDNLTWAKVLESVAHKLPRKFAHLAGQNGFKCRTFVKLFSTIVNQCIDLRHPGFSLNCQMETRLQDKTPISKLVGIVATWSDNRVVPFVAWRRIQQEHNVRKIRPVAMIAAAEKAKAAKEAAEKSKAGSSKEEAEVAPKEVKAPCDPDQKVADDLRAALPPGAADTVIGFLHGHERAPHVPDWHKCDHLLKEDCEQQILKEVADAAKTIAGFIRIIVAKKKANELRLERVPQQAAMLLAVLAIAISCAFML